MVFDKANLEWKKALEIAQSTIAEQKIILIYTEVPRLSQPLGDQRRVHAFNVS